MSSLENTEVFTHLLDEIVRNDTYLWYPVYDYLAKKLLYKGFQLKQDRTSWQNIFILAGIFLTITLALALHRYYSFYTSYDHGLFNQLFWNSVHGHFFQGSLSANNSDAAMRGQIPGVSYVHLGQHFVINFLLYLPIYSLFPSPLTLIVLQVVLITAGGLALYPLARVFLSQRTSTLIVASYYGANPVIGPALDNFYEQCQLPLFIFSALWLAEKQKWGWFWLVFCLTLLIREDTGITLFGIGAYWLLSRRYWRAGLGVCILSFCYVTGVTTIIMPIFSEDNSRLYLAQYFGKFLDQENPSTLDVLWAIITQPHLIIKTLFTDFDKRLRYLLGLWLPLGLVPVIVPPAWIMAAPPLLVLLLQIGNKPAFSINTRYTLGVMPVLIYGLILWLHQRQQRQLPAFEWRKFWSRLKTPQQAAAPVTTNPENKLTEITYKHQKFWVKCIGLSLIFTITSNPHRALYFLVPYSLNPWTYTSLNTRWEHGETVRSLIQLIPEQASVASNGYLVPHLSSRRAIVRLPFLQYQNEQGENLPVDYALLNVWQLQQSNLAAPVDRGRIRSSIPILDAAIATQNYGLIAAKNGVFLFKSNSLSQPDALASWEDWKTRTSK